MLVPEPIGRAFDGAEALPDPLPRDPFPLFARWFEEAHSGVIRATDRSDGRPLTTDRPAGAIAPNPNAMVLATAHDGVPSARVVLCKHVEPDPGFLVFYTNHTSQKGRAIASNARVSAVFHWDAVERQARVSGVAVASPDDESDHYFRTRGLASRLGAWASLQSQPLDSRQTLADRLAQVADRFGVPPSALDQPGHHPEFEVPRPPEWGGYRIHALSVELWCGGPGRVHDRARWTRDLEVERLATDPAQAHGPWTSTRLYP